MDTLFNKKIDTLTLFKGFWALLKPLDINIVGYNRKLLLICRVWYMVLICLLYPLHLALGYRSVESSSDFVSYVAMNIAAVCSLFRYFFLRFNTPQMRHIEALLSELDAYIESVEERAYFEQKIRRHVHLLLRMFVIVYQVFNSLTFVMWILQRERRLLFVSWVPFDIQHSDLLFGLVLLFQGFSVITIYIMCSFNDSYVPLTLFIIVGHTRLLVMRIRRMADRQENAESYLHACIDAHIKLIQILKKFNKIVSFPIIVNIFSSVLEITFTLFYVVFYSESIFTSFIFLCYATTMLLENYPTCYYGTLVEAEFHALTYEIFSCNWIEQNRAYRRTLLVFMTNTMQPVQLMAGHITPVNINTFIIMLRMAYSLFALAIQFRDVTVQTL